MELYHESPLDLNHIFLTYCDINEIRVTSDREKLVQLLMSKSYHQVITLHKRGFVRYYFYQLIQEEISLEQFMTMGDIDGQIDDQINPHIYQSEYPALLEALVPDRVAQRKEDDIVIIDPLILSYYQHKYGIITTPATIISLSSN